MRAIRVIRVIRTIRVIRDIRDIRVTRFIRVIRVIRVIMVRVIRFTRVIRIIRVITRIIIRVIRVITTLNASLEGDQSIRPMRGSKSCWDDHRTTCEPPYHTFPKETDISPTNTVRPQSYERVNAFWVRQVL